ncbi:autotransporter secretion outer membrane protein TamA [Halospina denitrificans]|uniref:Translocation and assembly module subunit TamA n=2 Tax=Halospina denitrificans TaxID=332522 RepID=A0A4V3EQS6_9GAMM|nr:autotransporter assembly complex family protein [Halospina denitrificans]TDT43148.1 autotransporter secretion outer membrane protein TamA [Halospina denitrificans]
MMSLSLPRLTTGLFLALFLPFSWAAELQLNLDPANDALESNIRAFIGDPGDRDAASLRRFSSHARERARQAMRALGYYQGRVTSRVLEQDPPVLKLEVVPGEPVRFRRVIIEVEGEAAGLAAFELPDELRPEEGEVLDHGRYERIKRFFRNQAQTHGFFDGAFVTRELRVDPEAGYADINLVYDSGERYTLGDVRFPEEIYFENTLLERFVRFEPGEPYHSDRIIELNRDLRGSGYFSNVRVEADAENAVKGRIPVQVALDERSRHSIGTGLGFSTDVGPRFRTTWDQHYVNPEGHLRGAELELSEPRQNAGLYYELPLDPPMTDSLRFTGSYQREDIEDTESKRISTGAQWHKELDSGWQQVLSLRREDDRFKVGDERGRTLLILPGASYSYLKRDSPVDPSRGYRLQVEAAGGQRDMLSDIDVLHATAEAKGLVTLGTGGHRFLSRIKVGAVGTNNFDRVPPFLRFFAGGDQSVRGYGFRTLSPVDEDGDSIGGRFLIAGSAEYQYPLSQSWRLAAFVDEGNAFDDMGDPLKTGVGVGIRWVSPVGPIRLDIARALDSPENFRLHFSMGPEL